MSASKFKIFISPTWFWLLHIWFALACLLMDTPPARFPVAGLGVYWLVDVFVEESMVGVVMDRSEEEEGEVIGMGLPMPGSVV